EQHALGGDADLAELLIDDEAVLDIAHHQRLLHAVEAQALQRLLEQRKLAGQGQELLGVHLARQGPEARTATTRKDYRNHGVSLHSISARSRAGTNPAGHVHIRADLKAVARKTAGSGRRRADSCSAVRSN